MRGVSDLERGVRRRPLRHTIQQLADALGLTLTARDTFTAAANAARDAPPLSAAGGVQRTDSVVRQNLPRQLTSFIGREAALVEVATLIAAQPLVTLTGVGGTGKTRLALAVVAHLLTAFRDGVWLVELAPLTDPLFVSQAVASVLQIHEQPGETLTAALVRVLQSRQLLLVLDNCEHLIGACAQLADDLLRYCPSLRVLATSREALGVPGEVSYRVPSLSLPRPDTSLASLAATEAVHLFITRAQAAQGEFRLTDANAALVVQLCTRLDGIPLALELAAARLRSLPLDQLVARLDDRFRLLTGGSRTALPRQRTLQAALDWSYRLLQEDERLLLQRLSIFAGGWTLDATEAVCVGAGLVTWQVLDLLTSLVEKSLVQLDPTAVGGRYRLLETVRQYAQERLLDTDEGDALRSRHAAWATALVLQLAPHIEAGAQQVAAFTALDAEQDNLRQALSWAREYDPAIGLRLAGGLSLYWRERGAYHEGRDWLTTFLASEGPADQTRALAWLGLGNLHGNTGASRAAYAAAEQSRALFHALHQQANEVRATYRLGSELFCLGEYRQALVLFEDALALAQAIPDQHKIGVSLFVLGLSRFLVGTHDTCNLRSRRCCWRT